MPRRPAPSQPFHFHPLIVSIVKNLLPFIFLLLLPGLSQAQYLTNGSFESNTNGTGSVFALHEVANWTTIGTGGNSQIQSNVYCGQSIPASNGIYFARVSAGEPLSTLLTRPIIRNQSLTIAFDSHIPNGTCSDCGAYIVSFYLADEDLSAYPNWGSIPASAYDFIGSISVSGGTSNWQANSLTTPLDLDLDYSTSSDNPCSRRFLIFKVEPDACSGTELRLDIDNLAVTTCTFQPNCSFDPIVNVDDTCGIVKFETDCVLDYGFVWDFGDGAVECDDPTGKHFYPILGSYNVVLRLIDANGCVGNVAQTVDVDCIHCDGVKADFDWECLSCEAFYEYDLETHTRELYYGCSVQFNNQSIPSSGAFGTSYTWQDETGSVLSTNINPVIYFYEPALAGPKTICLTFFDSNGCSDKICKTLYLPCTDNERSGAPPTLQQEPGAASAFSIVPNPASDWIAIQYNPDLVANGQQLMLDLFDVNGTRLVNKNINDASGLVKLNLLDAPNGIYFLLLTSRDNREVIKLMIQR